MDSDSVTLEKRPKAANKPRPPMTREQQVLATHYLPLAHKLAKPFKKAWVSHYDDFDSAACLGLINAAQSYDASKRVEFATYARKRILGELRDTLRDMTLSGFNEQPENAPDVRHLGPAEERRGRILFSEPDRPVEEELASRDLVESWMHRLPKAHSAVCRQIYLEGLSKPETAVALGRSKSRINDLHSQSLALLNESFYWKNRTAHEDDLVKPLWTRRKLAALVQPECPESSSEDLGTPEAVLPGGSLRCSS